jgi:hypothetical protein
VKECTVEYTLGLALEDYLPVIFSVVGNAVIAATIAARDRKLGMIAWAAVAMLAVGGLMKASWKLLMAINGTDVPLLSNALFPLIAPGFALLWTTLFAFGRLVRGKSFNYAWYLLPTVLFAASLAGAVAMNNAGGPWRMAFLPLATIGNIAYLILLARVAWLRRMTGLTVTYLMVMLVIIGMSMMASSIEQTIAVQWFEQITQTLANLAFMLATFQLSRTVRAEFQFRPALQPA